jgi:DNA-binding response OmpR family regulator
VAHGPKRGVPKSWQSAGVLVAGRPVTLAPREFDLLLTLVRFHDVALDRRKLLDLVWDTSFVSQRTVDVHIARLRDKLSGAGLRIETVWGSGYRLREETNDASAS